MTSKGEDALAECGLELRSIGDIYCRRQEQRNLLFRHAARAHDCEEQLALNRRNSEAQQKSGTEEKTCAAMGNHSPARIVAVVLSVLVFIAAMALNALAGTGNKNGPFHQSTGNVSYKYETEITPAGWTFSIWGVIYTWLSAMLAYCLTSLCRRSVYGWMYCEPAVLPYGFYLSWIVNMILNIVWLFLWDREQMVEGLIVLALVAFTNYLVIFFCCHGLHFYGAWLKKYHRVDLWLIRVLVQNGMGVYATWTTIATLLNFTIVLDYNAGLSKEGAATVSLSFLLIEVLLWFVVENFVLDKYVRYILTVYPVVILALSGNIAKHYDPAAPRRNSIFTAVLLALACVLFVVRVILVIWRHRTQPLYQDLNTEDLSPADISGKQKKIFI
ncbi:hypothetical protein AGOR_G00042520 [Albula goreensis]|uniref:Uncharacterized protein n=1 Tax=Albula goreensis TaxID=1534307 RepID=A0A8T3E6H0_9TELE|nr:hypothetical protein AGOR_G00042520 [Albula goreensis]